jgi:hypothetical protein
MAAKDEDAINRISAKAMGAEAPKTEAPKQGSTPQEQANQIASPQTEGDKAQEAAVMYKIKMGDGERNLTPQQIAGTYERYRDLNFKQGQMKPINDIAERMMKAGNANPEQVAKLMQASLQAFTKNAQMGKARPAGDGSAKAEQPTPNAQQPDMNAEFKKYEDENAISLPPGYREAEARLNQLEQRVGQSMNMMQQMSQRMGQQAQQGMQSSQQAQGDRQSVVRDTIANNLDRAQQAAGLPDDAVGDFQAYAGERGYTAEDFADAALTNKVVQDFANQRNTPEFERLRDMSSRRQAYLQTQSGGPVSAAAAPKQDSTMGRLAAKAMAERNP